MDHSIYPSIMFQLLPLARRIVIAVATMGLPFMASAGSAPTSAAATATAQTKYPIVLVHGLLGFDRLLGVDYWYQIPNAMRKAGATVLVAQVSAVNDNNVRGEQLLLQLKQWSAAKGYKKFNLIGHSQGGPTARYTAGVAPELVASVTTVGSPHDIDPTAAPDLVMQQLASNPKAVTSLGKTIDWLSGNAKLPQDPAALKAWAMDTASFNRRFPAGMPTTPCGQGPELASNGIYYYSVAGNKAKTNALDPSDSILSEGAVPSDGLVTVCSAHWGMVLRDDYPWNHLDQVNQVLGLIGKGAPDPVAFYVQQANRLKLKGL
jgi:triacylglycerol lipase